MDIWIDHRFFKVKNNYTIFQICAKVGINLPCFCYHERLSIAGNCRICVVEANNAMVVSCATMILDNMKIFTKTKRIRKAREGVLEFILSNHPLDCPICDQGGECDLQDILLTYGSDRGRFYELNKRSVNNLNCCGPFIKTVMTRCIHCTRCVRFVNEISAVYDFGVIGRGFNMEIGTYILNFIDDPLLANIIDLCPVGALISMPASFTSRNWEIKYLQSIDILDSLATSIKIGVSVNNVKRVVPNLEEYYDEWLTNKARFVYDSFNVQRLHYPKLKLFFKFISISWKIALYMYVYLLYNNSYNLIQSFLGPYSSLELVYNLKFFFNNLGCNNLYYFELNNNSSDFRYYYYLNNTLTNLNNVADLLILGCNLRLESPLLNSSFRKNYLNLINFKAYSIGLGSNYSNYPIVNLGSTTLSLYKFFLGTLLVNKYFLFNSYYNINHFLARNILTLNILLGSSSLIRNDSNNLLNYIFSYSNNLSLSLKSINVLSRNLGRISLMEVTSSNLKKYKLLSKKLTCFNFFLGLDNIFLNLKRKKNINIFLGYFFLSNFFEYINLVFSSSIYIENTFSYLNLEGRFRYTNKVITQSKSIFADYLIVNSLYILSKFLFRNNFSILKNFHKIIFYFNTKYNYLTNYIFDLHNFIKYYNLNGKVDSFLDRPICVDQNKLILSNSLFNKVIFNYYNSDIFSKLSTTLSLMALKIEYKNFLNN